MTRRGQHGEGGDEGVDGHSANCGARDLCCVCTFRCQSWPMGHPAARDLETGFTFLDAKGSCFHGRIVSLTSDRVAVRYWSYEKHPQPVMITLQRPDVRRISDGSKAIDIVYSGRSSWVDVRALQHIGSHEAVVLITKDGTGHKGRFSDVSDNDVKLMHGTKTVHIAEKEVAQVYYLREKPVGEGTEYAAQEMAFVDPLLWPYLLHVAPRFNVRVYDADMPEDNAPSECRQTSTSPL